MRLTHLRQLMESRTMSATKEYYRLQRNLDTLTNGQVSMGDVDWDADRLDKFKILITPNDGRYKGGKFLFSIRLGENYPSLTPPLVNCETEIYHPNITSDIDVITFIECYDEDYYIDPDRSNVCLNLLTEGIWNPSYGLESIVLGLLFLMHNPNFDDPLAIEFGFIGEEEREENIRKYMRGEEIDGVIYKTDFVAKDGPIEVDEVHIDKDRAALHTQTMASVLENMSENDNDCDACASLQFSEVTSKPTETTLYEDSKMCNKGHPISRMDCKDNDTPVSVDLRQIDSARNSVTYEHNTYIDNRNSYQSNTGKDARVFPVLNSDDIEPEISVNQIRRHNTRDSVYHAVNRDISVLDIHCLDLDLKEKHNYNDQSYMFKKDESVDNNIEENHDNYSTGLAAFDGSFVLFGGNDCDIKEFEARGRLHMDISRDTLPVMMHI